MNYSTPKRRSLDEIFDEVLMHFPAVSRQLVEFNAKRACVDFCEDSYYWQEHIGGIYVVKDMHEYDIPIPKYAKNIGIIRVFINENEKEINFDKTQTDLGSTYRYWNPLNNSILLGPNNRLHGKTVDVVACLKPNLHLDKFEVAENVLDDYYNELVSGTKARLYGMPGRDWSNNSLSREHRQIFLEGSRDALRRSGRGYSLLPDPLVNKTRRFY